MDKIIQIKYCNKATDILTLQRRKRKNFLTLYMIRDEP